MRSALYRKKPVVIEAMQWTGENLDDLIEFTDHHFLDIDEEDRADSGDPEATAQVFDVLHATWVLVYSGDYIIKGVQGEFYPCREDVFHDTYEAV